MARLIQFADDFSGKVVDADGISPDFKMRLGDEQWVIDATPETIDAMREALAPFTDKARIVVGSKLPRHLQPAETPAAANGNGHRVPPSNDQVREWAQGQPDLAEKVKSRGRVSDEITRAYQAAHLGEDDGTDGQ
jgi:hypothetical protein